MEELLKDIKELDLEDFEWDEYNAEELIEFLPHFIQGSNFGELFIKKYVNTFEFRYGNGEIISGPNLWETAKAMITYINKQEF